MCGTILGPYTIWVPLASSQQQVSRFATSTNTSTSKKFFCCTLKRRTIALLDLKHIDLASVFQSLSTVTKPDPNHLSVVIQLLGDLCNLLASGKGVFLKVSVEDLDGLRCEAGSPLALLGGLSAHKLYQVLLTFLIIELSLCQPALQHGFQLLGTFRSDVKLLKSWNKRQTR